MKKIMFFAAIAAVVSLASCQKDALNEAAGTESPVFTATISTGTKTTVNATDGKVAWESTDKITITDASEASATYKIKSIDGNTGKATFEVESGTLGQGPYTATYGTAPTTAQTYSATPGNLYMTASETSTNSLTFIVQCGLMEINLTKAGASVKSISVTGTPTGESETTYTLTCTEAQGVAEKKSFYIALPAGSYNKIVITNSEDKVCTLTAASGITLGNNHIKPVTFEGGKLDFLPKGALPYVFSVGPNTTNKVHFSQGNLTYNVSTTTWAFYEHQYDCAADGDASSTLISLFTWGYDAAKSIVPNGSSYVTAHTQDGDKLVYDKASSEGGDDWGVAYCESNNITVGTWRTLTKEEWQYLFKTDTPNRMVNGKPCYSNAMSGVTIGGATYKGIFLYPDDYSGKEVVDNTETWTWDKINSAGIVFLPAAGCRICSSVSSYSFVSLVGVSGVYWSSTAFSGSEAYGINFGLTDVNPGDSILCEYGFSVRLITDVK